MNSVDGSASFSTNSDTHVLSNSTREVERLQWTGSQHEMVHLTLNNLERAPSIWIMFEFIVEEFHNVDPTARRVSCSKRMRGLILRLFFDADRTIVSLDVVSSCQVWKTWAAHVREPALLVAGVASSYDRCPIGSCNMLHIR